MYLELQAREHGKHRRDRYTAVVGVRKKIL
jgi:hypothetical protein